MKSRYVRQIIKRLECSGARKQPLTAAAMLHVVGRDADTVGSVGGGRLYRPDSSASWRGHIDRACA